ncbi:MAG: endonuclease/exonuclease/phosphatase family protein, partial [Candidatus Aureabacteria bacterium]|nr:endonuclease/exonuclease/phosphatase family protein [Candidatus Auribacterota bacterium]
LKTGEKYPCSEWLYLILMQYKESPGDKNGKKGSEESITVMTLNMAHARKGTSNGTTNKKNRIENNLNHIVKVITHEHPLVVALQEADGETYRPDNFNQVEFISEKAKYPYIETGYHVIKKNFVYGTALLSLYPLSHTEMTTFLPSPPTPLKGFVVSRMKWPFPSWNKEVDVISLHLDFLRKHVRMKQVEQIIQKLKTRGKPLIVMGDFNCEPDIRENTLQYFCENLNLKMYNPYSVELVTFQLFKKRLDWILISPDFEFKSYRVLKDKISDHSGVIAEIAVRKQS